MTFTFSHMDHMGQGRLHKELVYIYWCYGVYLYSFLPKPTPLRPQPFISYLSDSSSVNEVRGKASVSYKFSVQQSLLKYFICLEWA